MLQATNLGYPRIGRQRELKKALEQFWSGRLSEQDLLTRAATLRQQHWLLQQELGLHHIPSNDFSLYDHVLDTIALVGAIPQRYHWDGNQMNLSLYFAMARGMVRDQNQDEALSAMEMTKWFDTNYHYIVPEFQPQQTFQLTSTKPIDEFLEAKHLGIHTRPVLLGPMSFLLLGKMSPHKTNPLTLLDRLLPVYEEVLHKLSEAGADWIQIDEPCLALDLDTATIALFQQVYSRLGAVSSSLRLLLATYFGDLGPHTRAILHLPVAAIHLDLVRAPQQLALALEEVPASLILSLGVVDGRNVWRTNLDRALTLIREATQRLGSERVLLAPSCSLLHVPVDLAQETRLGSELMQWLAFARQKLEEVVLLTRLSQEAAPASLEQQAAVREALEQRRTSPLIHDLEVKQRVAAVRDQETHRQSPFAVRLAQQQQVLALPLLPTTTIGSFPQTETVRATRAAYISGKLEQTDYEAFLREEITRTIRLQEEIGLDVLVHGEFERTDMVEYFGELLDGFAFTLHGWVQSTFIPLAHFAALRSFIWSVGATTRPKCSTCVLSPSMSKHWVQNTPQVAIALMQFGQLYVMQQRYSEAEGLYQRSFAFQERIYAPEHIHFISLLTQLGQLAIAQK